MKDFRFYAPTEVVFGKDAENKAGELAAKYGTRALLVYGRGSAVKSGLIDRVAASLEEAGVAVCLFGGAQPNPTLSHAEEGVKAAVSSGADLIIGVGGGSAIDTAKAIAHGAANPGVPLWDIWTKKVPLTRSLPVGAVLTMAAAGSEMSDSAVLTNESVGKKAGINTDFNRPKFAAVNPALGATVPKYQLAAGIADIMMHTMERYFIPDSHAELTDEIAEGLLRVVVKNGKAVVEDSTDYDAMCEIFWASSLSHNNLTECGRGKDFSVHKLGHALSAKYGATHGASLAAVWGSWAEEVYRDCLPRFCRFAEKVWGVNEEDEVSAAKEGIRRTVEFFSSIGMPTSLHELGAEPTDPDFRELALDATMNDSVTLSRIKPLGADDVERIYKKARWSIYHNRRMTGMKLSEIFKEEPDTWGLRGDPYFWDYLAQRADRTGDLTPDELEEWIKKEHLAVSGKELTEISMVRVEQFAHGGMSSGGLSGEWWCDTGIPLLKSRMKNP